MKLPDEYVFVFFCSHSLAIYYLQSTSKTYKQANLELKKKLQTVRNALFSEFLVSQCLISCYKQRVGHFQHLSTRWQYATTVSM